MRRNTQRLPWLAGLFCASLTGCILEERNGSDAPNPPSPPDLRTLPDLRADLLPSPDLAAPCGSDGILFMGKCIYDFYQLQQGATSCAGKSITLYDQGSQFKQVCDCACKRNSLTADLSYGSGMGCGALSGPVVISPSISCTPITLTGSGTLSYYKSSTTGSCDVANASQTSWKLDRSTSSSSYTYCMLNTETRRTASQECVIIEGNSTQCPTYYAFRGVFGFSPQSQNPDNCDCCNRSDYPDQPIRVYSDIDCKGTQFTPISTCANSLITVKSAEWNPLHCPASYSKTPLPLLTSQIVATQTVCCKP